MRDRERMTFSCTRARKNNERELHACATSFSAYIQLPVQCFDKFFSKEEEFCSLICIWEGDREGGREGEREGGKEEGREGGRGRKGGREGEREGGKEEGRERKGGRERGRERGREGEREGGKEEGRERKGGRERGREGGREGEGRMERGRDVDGEGKKKAPFAISKCRLFLEGSSLLDQLLILSCQLISSHSLCLTAILTTTQRYNPKTRRASESVIPMHIHVVIIQAY